MAAPTVGLTAAPAQHVLRILAHDKPARDAIGAIEEVRSRRAGCRAGVRIAQTKVAAGRMPGQADCGAAPVWEIAIRTTGQRASVARDEIRAALARLPCSDGAYFAWADEDHWGDTTFAPMPKGDVCRFIAAIAGFARKYDVCA
eukprot:2224833-Alexandrium_andersonii.AAC.1